jgi:hypothetical protein
MPSLLSRLALTGVIVLSAACAAPGITRLAPDRYPPTDASRIVVIPEDRKPTCAYKSIAEIADAERPQTDHWLWPEELPAFTKQAASIGADALWIQPRKVRNTGAEKQSDGDTYLRTNLVTYYALALKLTASCS